ncbi:MAG: iron chaperone [Gammaproteobacteria bacterium]
MNQEVTEYFSSLPSGRKETVDILHNLVIDLFPEVRVDMHYKMPTYHIGKGWVAIANQKQYVSLYTCGHHHIADFKIACPGIKTGKGCINFKDGDVLPLGAIKSVIEHAMNHPKPS